MLFLVAPLLGLAFATSFADLRAGLHHPLVGPALRLSLITTTVSLLVVLLLGIPLSWTLARTAGRLARAVEVLVQVPAVIPPAVAGVAMLLAFGRRGWLAGWLYPKGWSAAFTTVAVIMAEVFVSAPFFVQAAASAFRRVDEDLLVVARTLGASPLRVFYRIGLPLAVPGLLAGGAMSWARSLGEFGATLMFAGNLTGKTQTLPLAVYTAFESDLRAAQALSLVLVVVAFAVALRSWGARVGASGRATRKLKEELMLKAAISGVVGTRQIEVEIDTQGGPLVIVGPNGAGKTTLLLMILGVRRPRAGHIVVGGITLLDSARRIDLAVEKRRLGYVPQDYALFPVAPSRRSHAHCCWTSRSRRWTLWHGGTCARCSLSRASIAPAQRRMKTRS